MKKTCIIIAAYIEGEIRDIIPNNVMDNAYVICADAGYDKASAAGIKPAVIIGDFDSLSSELPTESDIKIVTLPSRKDYTDIGICLDFAVQHGFTEATVIGGLGGRIDHTIANLQNLVGFVGCGIKLTIIDAKNCITAINEDTTVCIDAQDSFLSVFAATQTAVVSIEGVSYPLSEHILTSSFPLGVSNEFDSDKAIITCHEGIIFITLSKKQ